MDPLREDDPVTLGPFTLRGRLGAGGMGVVYLADTEGGLEVAVKTVPRGVGNDVRVRLQREAELLATVDHPRIARFVDSDAEADEPWLAMRYIPGPSLADADLPLLRHQLRQLADGLAESLAALHRLGVTHRDVKPGNVIMTSHGAVLVDLGIAVTADADSMTMTGTAVGSPAWMAPEQFAGDGAGPPADVWGWAAVLTYAATGREPFGAGTIAALAHRIMTQPADLRDVPDWLRGAVQLAFTKQPEERPKAFDLIRGGRARVPNASHLWRTPVAPPAGVGPSRSRQPQGRRPTGPPAGSSPSGAPPFAGRQPGPPPQGGYGRGSSRPQQRDPHPSGPPRQAPAASRQPPPSRSSREQSAPVGPRSQNPPSGGRSSSGPQAVQRAGAGRHGAARPRTRASTVSVAAAAVLVVGAIVAVLVVTLSGGGDAQPSPGPSGGSESPAQAAISVDLLKKDGLCSDGCAITGKVAFTHPRWGKVTLVTTQPADGGDELGTGDVAVIDAQGKSPWHSQVSPIKTFAPVKDPIDSSANIFMTYNAGSKDGVVVVGPTAESTGMDAYSTVPDGASADDARFYDATLSKVDGQYHIVKKTPGCASCAPTTYVWNTINYVVK